MSNDIAASSASAVSNTVTSALKQAAAKTGVGFDYLLRTAQRESSLNPAAKAATSSAAGLFQFIEQTWLGAIKKYGARHAMGDIAAEITRNAQGAFEVASPARRREILDMRFDATKAAALAGELAQENKSYLERTLGRAVGAAELYTAHFLGAGGAVKLLSAASNAVAAEILPKAAAANRPVFFDGARARTVGEVTAAIGRSMAADIGAVSNSVADANAVAAASDFSAAHRTNRTGGLAAPAEEERRALLTEAVEPLEPRPVHNADWRFSLDALLSPSKLLSPLAIAVLQALDPAALARDHYTDGNRDDDRGTAE